MDNEIKEILDKLNNSSWEKDEEAITYKILFSNEVYKLLNCITNLQTIEREYTALLSENAELENKIINLQEENQQLKELKYKFFDCSGEEESFTLEDYLELGNKLYDSQEEIKEYEELLNLQNNREYAKRYLEERRKEQPNLLYPDYDEIYKRYYEQKDKIKQLEEENERISNLYKTYEEANDLWIKKCDNYKSKIDEAIEYNYELQERYCHSALFDDLVASKIYEITEKQLNILE